MNKCGSDTLIVFPCCAGKRSGGEIAAAPAPKLPELISEPLYNKLLQARGSLLQQLQYEPGDSGKGQLKNQAIKLGFDFGQADNSGRYWPALRRYAGSLYTAVPDLEELINKRLGDEDSPHLLILSALYGPLHPLDLIQDYELAMGDKRAKAVWKGYLPLFFKEYLVEHQVKHIKLYLGSKTAYHVVMLHAINQIRRQGVDITVTSYDVLNAVPAMRVVPHNHGLLLANHLDGGARSYTHEIVERTW